MKEEPWITAEAGLWNNFMTPSRGRLNLHSLSPEKRKEVRQDLAKQKEQEFLREWEAYDRWLQH